MNRRRIGNRKKHNNCIYNSLMVYLVEVLITFRRLSLENYFVIYSTDFCHHFLKFLNITTKSFVSVFFKPSGVSGWRLALTSVIC